jgi:hypothetical protein
MALVNQYIIFTCIGVRWLIRRVSDLMIGFIALYTFTTRDYRQYSAFAIVHTFHFTVAHALRFSVFTSRILVTDLSQSHCHFKSDTGSSCHSLSPFLPLLYSCQIRRLDWIQFQAHIPAGWRRETRPFTLDYSSTLILFRRVSKSKSHCDWWSGSQSVNLGVSSIWGSWPDIYYCLTVTVLLLWAALSEERTGQSFVRVRRVFWLCPFITHLHWPHRKHSLFCWRGVFTVPLLINGYTRHVMHCMVKVLHVGRGAGRGYLVPYLFILALLLPILRAVVCLVTEWEWKLRRTQEQSSSHADNLYLPCLYEVLFTLTMVPTLFKVVFCIIRRLIFFGRRSMRTLVLFFATRFSASGHL